MNTTEKIGQAMKALRAEGMPVSDFSYTVDPDHPDVVIQSYGQGGPAVARISLDGVGGAMIFRQEQS